MGLAELAETAGSATFRHLELAGLSAACLGTDDARIATLNAEFRDKPTPTNVLYWPSETHAPEAPGATPPQPNDPEFAEADAAGIAPEAHVTHLVVHGILHLLGYDHEDDLDADLMENTEIAILMSLGIDNPYS